MLYIYSVEYEFIFFLLYTLSNVTLLHIVHFILVSDGQMDVEDISNPLNTVKME